MSQQQIQWQAKWIWIQQPDQPGTVVAAFRRTFSLAQPPCAARLLITADTFYRVWVNGKPVAWGPAGSKASSATVDIFDVSALLRTGDNCIAIMGVFADTEPFLYEALAQAPGVLAQLEITSEGWQTTVATDATWRARLVRLQPRGVRLSGQRAVIEQWDLTDLGNWTAVDFDDSAWQDAVEIGPVGCQPWQEIELRDVPNLEFLPYEVRRIVDVGRVFGGSDHLPKWSWETEVPSFIARLETEQFRPDSAAVADAESACMGPLPVTLQGEGAYAVFDFGELRVGQICIDLCADSEAVLEAAFHERRSADGHVRPREHLMSNQACQWKLPAGCLRVETFAPHNVRFLKLVNRGQGKIQLRRIFIRSCHIPERGAGGMVCSDETINRVIEAARHTIALNTCDKFLDCPSRERGGWLHDGYFNAMAAFHLLGELSVNRRMCRLVGASAGRHDPPGMVEMLYPANVRHNDYIPAHAMMWILQLGLDELYTGSRDYVATLQQPVAALLESIAEWENEHGLLENVPSWNFVDWADVDVSGVPLSTNAYYIMALDEAARLYDRADWAEKADRIRKAINQLCPGGDFYPDNLIREGSELVPGRSVSETVQVLMIRSGVAQGERARKIWAKVKLLPLSPYRWRRRYSFIAPAGVFGRLHRMKAAAIMGDYEEIVRMAREFWGPQALAEPGTLWEMADGSASRNHGFASACAAYLISEILGIKPGMDGARSLGFTQPLIAPHPAGLQWARGWLSTPAGPIGVAWRVEKRRFELEIGAPDAARCTVDLPEEARCIFLQAGQADDWPGQVQIQGSGRVAVKPGRVEVGQR